MEFEKAFEHPFGAGALTGDLTVEVLDPTGYQPTTIIQRDHAWFVKMDWKIAGSAAPFVNGDWKVQVYLESIGGGFEGPAAPPVTVPTNNLTQWSTTLNVPAAQTMGLQPGTYRLTTVIQNYLGATPREIAAFTEGPMLLFITA